VLPKHLREEALCHHREEYRRLNPGIDDADDVMHASSNHAEIADVSSRKEDNCGS
jgi:hypothetical protein